MSLKRKGAVCCRDPAPRIPTFATLPSRYPVSLWPDSCLLPVQTPTLTPYFHCPNTHTYSVFPLSKHSHLLHISTVQTPTLIPYFHCQNTHTYSVFPLSKHPHLIRISTVQTLTLTPYFQCPNSDSYSVFAAPLNTVIDRTCAIAP